MGLKRALGDFKELRDSVVELFDDDRSAEAEASLRITRSAQRFTKNTKEVVDDKLSFSATLMRAGEVQAAKRLLAEVEHDVREEEAALFESVNEVKVAQSLRRTRVTRLRLARVLAVAALGSAVLSFSAAGMAVAGYLRDRAEAISRPTTDGESSIAAAKTGSNGKVAMATLRIGQVDLLLTKSQFERLKALGGSGTSSIDELEDLLNALPDPLADQIKEAITVAEGEVAEAESNSGDIVAQVSKESVRKKRAAKKAAAEAQEEAKDEEAEPTPKPSPSDDDSNQQSNEEEEDSGSEEEEGDGGPPIPPLRP